VDSATPRPVRVPPRTATIVAFLDAIGIPVRLAPVTGPTALPGITIADAGLVLDAAASFHDGDLLHEAGHLALLPPSQREMATGTLAGDAAGYELGAICWSVAAARQLGLGLDVVFHGDGYRGESDWFAETYASGAAPGLPLVQWAGLTWIPGQEPEGEDPFPTMRQWLRTTEIPTD
jgi:hypothetical protein